MEQVGGERQGERTSITQVALASFIGTTVEWYDFFLYGTAAALVFGPLFFPEFSPLAGTLAALGTFAVGFVARPVGGIFFGHYGDKIGRKSMLVITLLMMGFATFCIGLLPTYESVGVLAPILLVLLRLIQGFALGGEWGGAVLMAVEHAPPGRRGFYGSWPQTGALAGLLISTAVLTAFTGLSEEQFLAWGWRVPFLLSIVLVGVGLFIRLKISESPAFEQVKESQAEAGMPIVDVFRNQPKSVLLGMGARFAENGVFYIISIFILDYATRNLGMERGIVLRGVLIGAAIAFFTVLAYGALSDRLGRRPVYLWGAGFSLVFAFPFFWLVDTKSPFLIAVAVTIGLAVGHAAMYGPQGAFMSELFGTRVRYSGASIGYQLASVLAGGLAPTIAVALLAASGGEPWSVALYMIGMCVVTIVAVLAATETNTSDIAEEGSRASRPTPEPGGQAT
jgi:MHS family shikimate/dehydroshikimate transporter-like MFS transporter